MFTDLVRKVDIAGAGDYHLMLFVACVSKTLVQLRPIIVCLCGLVSRHGGVAFSGGSFIAGRSNSYGPQVMTGQQGQRHPERTKLTQRCKKRTCDMNTQHASGDP